MKLHRNNMFATNILIPICPYEAHILKTIIKDVNHSDSKLIQTYRKIDRHTTDKM